MLNKIFAAALAASVLMPVAAQAQRAPAAVIVVVDSDRIYRECTACKTAQTQLQGQVTALQNRSRTLEAQLRPEGQAIQTAANALKGKEPDAALKTRATNFQKKQSDAQQELQRSQQNIQSIQANVVKQIDAQLRPAINSVMVAKGANLAVDVEATLAHGQGLDVTADVLAAVNRALPSVSLTPLPQSQQQQPQGR